MAIAPHAAEAIAAMRAAGRRVILLTAGVPDPLVKDLAAALGADLGAGMRLEVKDGRLTGRISGELARTNSKLEFVARLVEREGIPWRNVAAVGDDRNNLPLMRRAGVSIGFHAEYIVRRRRATWWTRTTSRTSCPARSALRARRRPHHPARRARGIRRFGRSST